MPDSSKVREFPDISTKLSAPTKKSAFEKQKEEAEAKRRREEAENAAALEDFVKSFEDDGQPTTSANRPGNNGYGQLGGMGGSGLGGVPRRHFVPSGPRTNSGPGTLGPAPPLSRKRAHDGSFAQQRDRGLFAFEDTSGPVDTKVAFQESDEEDEETSSSKAAEKAAPKPTIHLSSLPPEMSEEEIIALLPSSLTIDRVQPLPPAAPGSTERKSASAIVTLAKDTPGSEIDSAVGALQKRYLGKGFYLSISRHLSSAVLSSTAHNSLLSTASSLPFGAKSLNTGPGPGPSFRNAPPPTDHRRGFAPPASLVGGVDQSGRPSISAVHVNPPTDLRQLKLINKTIERVLKYGEEVEVTLMNQEHVQRDEKWAWLWDARSPGAVYYRWRVWSMMSGAIDDENPINRLGMGAPEILFEDEMPWNAASQGLRHEFSGYIDEFVSDPEYESEGYESSDDEARQRQRKAELSQEGEHTEPQYLNPLQKAKLTYILYHLPASTARLSRRDVAQVTNFAIDHAGQGAEEVVQMLIWNVISPLSLIDANPDDGEATDNSYQDSYSSDSGYSDEAGFEDEPEDVMQSIEQTTIAQSSSKMSRDQDDDIDAQKEKEDPSHAKLVALYIISDILNGCATAGVKNAWKYKPLIETAFKEHKVFERLGRLEKEMDWGKIKAERWRNAVTNLLNIWEGWSVFSVGTPKEFTEVFTNPPPTEDERERIEKEEKEREARREKAAKFKATKRAQSEGLDGEPMEEDDLDGAPMDDEDIDGQPMEEDDIDGQPMDDEDIESPPMEEEATFETPLQQDASEKAGPPPVIETEKKPGGGFSFNPTKTVISRGANRPKAVDMFAESDEE